MALTEGFESGDLANWDGATSVYEATQDFANSGSWSAHPTASAGSSNTIYHTGTEGAEESRIPIFHDSVQSGSAGGGPTLHRQVGSEDYYCARWGANDTLELQRVDGGTPTTLDSVAATWSSDTWLAIELRDDGTGTLTAEAFDGTGTSVATVSFTDTTYTGGYAGIRLRDTETYADDFEATAPPAAPTNLSATGSTANEIDLSWDDNNFEDGYNIYRNTSNDFSTATQIDSVGQDVTTYTDTTGSEETEYWYWVTATNSKGESSESNADSAVLLAEPTSVTASVDSNFSITISWTDNSSFEDNYEIEINRDGAGYVTPGNGGSVGANSTSTTITGGETQSADTDTVGIDSSFDFRVRATTTGGDISDWVVTDHTVYTDPSTPGNPTVSRPDSNQMTLSWDADYTHADRTLLEVRKDTGTGYGSWSQFASDADTSNVFDENDAEHEEDARFQFRARAQVNTPDISPRTSEYVYFDYGNGGNLYFEDTFEDQDVAEWDSVDMSNGDSQIMSGSSATGSLAGAEEGTYYLQLNADDSLVKNLGDLSGETDVLVHLAYAQERTDDGTPIVEFYDGTAWQTLKDTTKEYNEAGWQEGHFLVPDSYLSTDNRLRISTVGVDLVDRTYFDRVRVTDVLHEYTKPPTRAPSNIDVYDTSGPDVRVHFNDSTRVTDATGARVQRRETGEGQSFTVEGSSAQLNPSPIFTSGETHGERYDYRVAIDIDQPRFGSSSDQIFASGYGAVVEDTMPLLEPTTFSTFQQNVSEVNASWDDNNNTIDGYRLYEDRGDDGVFPVLTDAGDTNSTVVDTFTSTPKDYAYLVEAYTEHVTRRAGEPAFSNKVLHYTCDNIQTVSGVALDTSEEFQNDGTLNGVTTGASGYFAEAYSFDGTANISTGLDHQGESDIGSRSAGSVSLWYKANSADTGALFATNNDRDRVLELESTDLRGTMFNNAGTNPEVRVARPGDGNWHHVVFTWNITASELELYLDGTLVDSANEADQTEVVNGSDIRFGDNLGMGLSSTGALVGDLDDIRLYNTRISSTTVSSIFTGGQKDLVNIEIATPTLDPLDASTEDQLGVSWQDTIDNNNGVFSLEFKDSDKTEYLESLHTWDVVNVLDSTTDLFSQANSTIGTTTLQSVDGTAITVSWDGGGTPTDSGVSIQTSDDLTQEDFIQFWVWNESNLQGLQLQIFDGTSSDTVSVPEVPPEGQGFLVQVDLSQYTNDLSTVDSMEIQPTPSDTAGEMYVDQLRAGQATYDDTVSTATLEYLEDGEEYDVRVRGENSLDASPWSELAKVTKLPAPTAMSATVTGPSSVDASWTDNADTEDEYVLRRARKYDDGYGPTLDEQILAVNTESTTDTDVVPSTTYRYNARAQTEHVTADSGTVEVTTDSIDVGTRDVPSRGWYAEIDHPDGRTLRPQILERPQVRPRLNDYPDVELPIRRRDELLESALEDATLRMWYDGVRRAGDAVEDVTIEPGRAVLKGRGGLELKQRVEAQYTSKAAHTAAQDLINTHTSYTANVDAPQSETLTDEQMQSADTDSELSDTLLQPIADTDPLQIINSEVVTYQTAFTQEAEDGTTSGTVINETADYSGNGSTDGEGQAVSVTNTDDSIEITFTLDYTMPASAFEFWFRADAEGTDTASLSLEIEGPAISGTETLTSGLITNNGTTIDWFQLDQADPSADLTPGTYTVRIVAVSGGTHSQFIDVLVPLDNRYSYTFDNVISTNASGNNYLDGPEPHPDAVPVTFEDVSSAYNIVAALLQVTMDDTSNAQKLEASNDQGATWLSASNTSTLDQDFTTNGAQIRARITLSRYGTGTTTPATGQQSQALDAFTLSADLEDTPILTNKRFDGSLMSVLQEIAEFGDFVFQFHVVDGVGTIEWTRPGNRTADNDTSLLEWDVTKSTRDLYEKAIIYGSRQSVRQESFTSNHGTAVALDKSHLLETTEVVYDTADGTQFERGVDYDVDYQAGSITTKSSGAMADATTYAIDYDHKTRGEHTKRGATSPDIVVETIPDLVTDRSCDQAALFLVQHVSAPRYTARLVLNRSDLNTLLVDDLQVEGLPTDVRFIPEEITHTPGKVVLKLGSRQSVGAVVQELRNRVAATASKV